jgi:hypothetical protein
MKKVLVFFSIFISIIILSGSILDSLSLLSSDINNHLWISVVGQWESRENPHYNIKFGADGTFTEYYYGVIKGYGGYDANGNKIILYYDESTCRQDPENMCAVNMRLLFTGNTIILENIKNKMSFNKRIVP